MVPDVGHIARKAQFQQEKTVAYYLVAFRETGSTWNSRFAISFLRCQPDGEMFVALLVQLAENPLQTLAATSASGLQATCDKIFVFYPAAAAFPHLPISFCPKHRPAVLTGRTA
jgi:hypothetical protein